MFKISEEKEFRVIGMGEVMLRLSPENKERISQSKTFEKNAGGSELNVVSGISQLGARTGIITKLPDNEIGRFVKNQIRYSGVSDDYIIYDKSDSKRLGIYYYEKGAYPRLPVVVYDRAKASFTGISLDEINPDIYKCCNIFHVSGITLALSDVLRENTIELIKNFKAAGAIISFDVNYRMSLWDEKTARNVIERILPYIGILFVSEETLRRMFSQTGELKEIHKRFSEKYPGLKIIASTERKVVSATKHSFGSLMYDCEENRFFEEPPYENIEVVDRLGSGDAYVGGALFGLIKFGTIENAVKYGNAMAAVKNTIPGDMPVCDITDINRIIASHSGNGTGSEMIR